jgi:hypothetical protein
MVQANPAITLPGWNLLSSSYGVDMYRVNGKWNIGASYHGDDRGWMLSVDPHRWWWIAPIRDAGEREWMPALQAALKHLGGSYQRYDTTSNGALSIKFIDRRLWEAVS